VQSSGRLFAGGGIKAELVLFETLAGNFLDHGVPSALISLLHSQCKPTVVTHARTSSQYSDYIPGLNERADLTVKLTTEKALFEQVGLGDAGNTEDDDDRVHLIVLDGLNSILREFQIQSITKLLHRARRNGGDGNHRTIFAAIVHAEDFDKSTRDALRSLATSNVQVIQQAAGSLNGVPSTAASFTISNDLTLHVRRRKDGKSNHAANDADDAAAFTSQLNLPFKVTLSKEERMARAAVQLPFVHRDADIADSGLTLHPSALQVSAKGSDGEESSSSSSDEGLFSEDV